ncbi:MAG: O-antigen ligase family protein [Alphaproteobacteria bacterium]
MTERPSRWTGIAVALAAAATPLLALHAHRAATPILAVAATGAMAAAYLRDRRLPLPAAGFAILLAAVLGWATLGLAWSIAPAAGIDLLPRVAAVCFGALMLAAVARDLPAAEAEIARTALVAGVAGGALLLAAEAATGGAVKALLSDKEHPTIAIKAGSTILALLAWPAMAVLWERGRPVAAFLLLAALTLPMAALDGRAAVIALVAGAATAAAAWAAPRTTALALTATAAAGILLAPLLALKVIHPWLGGGTGEALLPFSGQHRIAIWRFAASHVMERPLLGWGFNASRSFPGGKDPIEPWSGAMQMPLHPHNAALQWWLELGLPGAVAGAVFVALAARAALASPTRASRVTGLAMLAAGIVVAMLSYGAWQNWWLAAVGLAAAFAAAGRGGRADAPIRRTDPPAGAVVRGGSA